MQKKKKMREQSAKGHSQNPTGITTQKISANVGCVRGRHFKADPSRMSIEVREQE